jgi:mRNA interferase HigB
MEPGPKNEMHVITRKRLVDFWMTHTEAETPLKAWLQMMRHRRYADSNELKSDFPKASVVGDGCTVFDIGGNKYRLVVTMRYDMGKVFIYRVLTHAEYDEHNRNGTLCPPKR